MFRRNCMVCNSSDMKEIINLGLHNFADTFLRKEDLEEPEKLYPLICDLCMSCGQVQLRAVTDPKERYMGHDYSYTSSNSKFSRKHWEEFANTIISRLSLNPGKLVVEAGSNDGFLTKQFLLRGNKVLGVDPSDYMAKLAEKEGVKTIVGLFNKETARKILSEHGKAGLVIANNVFNHSNEPLEFARAAAEILEDNGTFVYEMPYWYISVKDEKFDQIYHEHVSYFTVKSSAAITERAGMYIHDAEVVDYHGGSLRIYAKLKEGNEEHCEKALKMINDEEREGLFRVERYNELMSSVINKRNRFMEEVHHIKNNGGKIIGVGAAAKGNTMLTYYNLNSGILDFVTDSSPHKQGKYTPATRVPITGDEIFSKYEKPHALILSWNISEQIKAILQKINPNIQFITPWKEHNL
ncbi:methyltransferase domain-containing protein [Candidatus Pacearchaeota archaeon]|nr:methyltransferase domain-containing protein [Candidatus Pacearchaeota archaeon]